MSTPQLIQSHQSSFKVKKIEKSSMTLSITIQKTGSHNFEKYAVRGHASPHESGLGPAAPHSPVPRHWSHDRDSRLF